MTSEERELLKRMDAGELDGMVETCFRQMVVQLSGR